MRKGWKIQKTHQLIQQFTCTGMLLIYMPAKPVACAILHSTGNNLSLWLILNWKGLKQHVPSQVHTRQQYPLTLFVHQTLPVIHIHSLHRLCINPSVCVFYLTSLSHTHTHQVQCREEVYTSLVRDHHLLEGLGRGLLSGKSQKQEIYFVSDVVLSLFSFEVS